MLWSNPVGPCQNYENLQEDDRSIHFTSNKIHGVQNSYKCDDNLRNRWYRINGGLNSRRMLEKCPLKGAKCSTGSSGWMNGKHPLGKN